METNKIVLSPEQEAQQREYKAAKERFRTAIKSLAESQVNLKPQRKTVTFTGERKMDPGTAATTVRLNSYDLRHLHIAYALFRGKSIPEADYIYGVVATRPSFIRKDGKAITYQENSPNMDYVTKLLQEHGSKTVYLGKK